MQVRAPQHHVRGDLVLHKPRTALRRLIPLHVRQDVPQAGRCCVRVGNGRTYNRAPPPPILRRGRRSDRASHDHEACGRAAWGAVRGDNEAYFSPLLRKPWRGTTRRPASALSAIPPFHSSARGLFAYAARATAAACGASISSPPTCRARSSTARSSTPGSPPATSSSDTPRTYS